MALSNMGNEPQRELTETVVGLAVIGVAIGLDYKAAEWFQTVSGPGPDKWVSAVTPCPIGLGMVIFPIMAALGVLALWGAALLVHATGEGICNALARRGVELRPKIRK